MKIIKDKIWLIAIFILCLYTSILATIEILHMHITLCFDAGFWTAIGAIGTIITVIIAFVRYNQEVKRRKKEETLIAIELLEKEVLTQSYMKGNIKYYNDLCTTKNEGSNDTYSPCINLQWEKITTALARIEHFAAGINSNIYDLELLNRMAGNLMIKTYDKLFPIIMYKRKSKGDNQNYIEFRTMVNDLIAYRNKSPNLYGFDNFRN